MLAIFLLVLLMLYVRNKISAVYVVLFSSILAVSITETIKHLLKITRPEIALIYEDSYRFPSLHATTAAVVMTLIVIYSHKYIKNENHKSFLCLVGVIWFVVVCYSRLYLHVHYFIDVLVGGVIGIISTLVVMKVLRHFGYYK